MVVAVDRSRALDLLALCQAMVMGWSLLVTLACLFVGPLLSDWRGINSTEIMLLPLMMIVMGLHTVIMSWLVTDQAFAQLARVRFATIVGSAGCQVGLGQLYPDAMALIVGFLGGYIVGLILAAYYCRRALAAGTARMRLSRMRRAAVEYRAFALFSLPASLIGILASQLPSTILPSLYGLTVAGQYSLAQRVLYQPTVLVGEAVNHVFYGYAARLSVGESARLWDLFVRLNICLVALMTPAFVLTWIGPEIFTFLFGSAWREAGTFAGVMVVATMLGLAAQGTTGLPAYQLHHWSLAWQVGRAGLLIGALGAAWQMGWPPMMCIVAITAALAISQAALFGLNAVAIWRAKSRAEQAHDAAKAAVHLLKLPIETKKVTE
jgi:O-antigen/teichoic acid export membrane protein